jgi:hypothetical protein
MTTEDFLEIYRETKIRELIHKLKTDFPQLVRQEAWETAETLPPPEQEKKA